MSEELIGHVTHWYGGIGVAGIHVDSGEIHPGDVIHIVGHTTDLEERVGSMQIDHEQVAEARTGDDVGVTVSDHVRENDKVYVVH